MPFIQRYGEWTLEADDKGYHIYSEGEDGVKRFSEVTPGPYNNPIMTAEPGKALPVPDSVKYEDVNGAKIKPTEKIAGIICKKAGEVMHRFSLSSPDRPPIAFGRDTSELLVGREIWHLRVLFRKDANRTINYDAFYGEEEPEKVKIIELEDLNFES